MTTVTTSRRASIALDYLARAVEDRDARLIAHYTGLARLYGADDEHVRHLLEGG